MGFQRLHVSNAVAVATFIFWSHSSTGGAPLMAEGGSPQHLYGVFCMALEATVDPRLLQSHPDFFPKFFFDDTFRRLLLHTVVNYPYSPMLFGKGSLHVVLWRLFRA